jgi:hypothetical protein
MPIDYSLHTGVQQQDQTQTTKATPPVQATAENLEGVGNLGSLSALINQINLNAQQAANAARIPNAPALQAQSSADILSGLRGELPQDVSDQLARQAAERGIASGIAPGSPNIGAEFLGAVGMNSYQLMNNAQAQLNAAYAANPAAPLYDPTGQLVTPGSAGTTTTGTGRTSSTQLGSQSYPDRGITTTPQYGGQPSGAGGTYGAQWNNAFQSPQAPGTSTSTTIPGMEGYLGVADNIDPLAYVTMTDPESLAYAPGWWQPQASPTQYSEAAGPPAPSTDEAMSSVDENYP